MLEIDPNVDITFIIPGSVQYLYGRAAERNAGSRAHRVGTGQKEKQNPALRRAILGWGFRSLRWHWREEVYLGTDTNAFTHYIYIQLKRLQARYLQEFHFLFLLKPLSQHANYYH